MSEIETELPEPEVDVEEVLDSSTDGADDTETPAIEEEGSEAQAEEAPKGRVRGPDGKFVKAAPPEEGVAQEEAGEEAEAAPIAEAAAAPKGRAVQLKADGQMYDLPGATLRDDGIVELDAQGFDVVHRYVGQAIVAQRKIEKLTRENAEISQRTTAEAEYVKRVGEQYAQLALLAQENPEEAVELLRGFAQQLPALQAQMEAEHWRRVAEQGQKAMQPDPQVVQAQREEAFGISMKQTWDEALQAPWAKGLAPEDVEQLAKELWEVRDSFLVVATQDDPANDIQRGEWLFNEPKMVNAMKARAEYVANLRRVQQKVAASAQRNAEKKVVAPPMGAGKRVGNTTVTPQPKAKSREEWQKQNLW